MMDDLPASDSFREAFAAADATQPVVLWRPAQRDLRHPLLRRFSTICEGLRGADGALSLGAFESAEMGALRDFTALVAPCPPDEDFRFLFYGIELQSARGQDLTGRTTADLAPYLRQLFNALFRHTIRTGYSALSIFEPVQQFFASDRIVLVIPLTDEAGLRTHAAIFTVSVNNLTPGLEVLPDPALVIQPDQRVIYANGQAEALFGARSFQAQAITLSDYAGIELDLTRADSASADWLSETEHRAVRNSMLVRFRVTTRKVLFRNRPFFVVIARPS